MNILRGVIRQGGETLWVFPMLMLLGVFRFIRGDFPAARRMAEEGMRIAEKVHDQDLFLTANVLHGMISCYSGELTLARNHLERVIARYDIEKHRSVAFRYGNDPGATALAFASMMVGLLGYTDEGLEKNRAAISLAREVNHPFSLCLALGASAVYYQILHEWPVVIERAEEEIKIASERKFPFWLARATIMKGWARAEEGYATEGIARIREGLDGWRATGARIAQSYFLSLLAEAYQKNGQIEAGLTTVAEGLQFVDQIGEHVWEAELYRLKGVLTLKKSGVRSPESAVTDPQPLIPDPQAEAYFHKALGIARQQHAKVLELKAALSLSRLWQRQGKKTEARVLLAEIYGWFTQGLGMKDLQEAKALLAELA